jgi:hypothetical protein
MSQTLAARKPIRLGLALCLLVAMCLQTACGTLIYPERRGQTSGKIDPGIAILDGLGLLLFVVPGLIAFAIDFSTGAIYLPPDEASAESEGQVVHVNPDQLTRSRIQQVVKKHTGRDIDLSDEDMRILRKQSAAEARAAVQQQPAAP